MSQCRLRVYHGPDSMTTVADNKRITQNGVTVPAGEVLALLTDAIASDRTWLRDFEEDEVTISTDLYEVLLAYQYYRRPSA